MHTLSFSLAFYIVLRPQGIRKHANENATKTTPSAHSHSAHLFHIFNQETNQTFPLNFKTHWWLVVYSIKSGTLQILRSMGWKHKAVALSRKRQGLSWVRRNVPSDTSTGYEWSTKNFVRDPANTSVIAQFHASRFLSQNSWTLISVLYLVSGHSRTICLFLLPFYFYYFIYHFIFI